MSRTRSTPTRSPSVCRGKIRGRSATTGSRIAFGATQNSRGHLEVFECAAGLSLRVQFVFLQVFLIGGSLAVPKGAAQTSVDPGPDIDVAPLREANRFLLGEDAHPQRERRADSVRGTDCRRRAANGVRTACETSRTSATVSATTDGCGGPNPCGGIASAADARQDLRTCRAAILPAEIHVPAHRGQMGLVRHGFNGHHQFRAVCALLQRS